MFTLKPEEGTSLMVDTTLALLQLMVGFLFYLDFILVDRI